MLGKELTNAQNNIWLNYAIPTAEFATLDRRDPHRQAAGRREKRSPSSPTIR